jgi:Mg/Co/Ni transporter MgtE
MDVRSLAEWHKSQASRAAGKSMIDGKMVVKKEFHLDAANLVETLSGSERDRLLVALERDVKVRAIESLEKLAKSLIVEARELRKMLAEEISDE